MSEHLIHDASRDFVQEESEAQLTAPATADASTVQTITGAAADAYGKQALLNLAETAPWLGALLESIAQDPASPVATFITQWGGHSGPEADPEKHSAYSAHVRATVNQTYPWLWPLFDAASARLAVSPGAFIFFLPHRPLVAFDVPALVRLTHLTPWVEPGETQH